MHQQADRLRTALLPRVCFRPTRFLSQPTRKLFTIKARFTGLKFLRPRNARPTVAFLPYRSKQSDAANKRLKGRYIMPPPSTYSNLASTHLLDIPFLAPRSNLSTWHPPKVKLGCKVHSNIAALSSPNYDKSDLNRPGFQ